MTAQGSPFWTFSLAVYGANGVQDECLALQDRFGVDVNVLLLCAFLGAVHSVALTAGDVAAARREVGLWHEEIVKTLRAARHKLKAIASSDADTARAAAQLRNDIKAAELESERIEQQLLEHWANARLAAWPRDNAGGALATNLQALLAVHGVMSEPLAAVKHLMAAARDRAAIAAHTSGG